MKERAPVSSIRDSSAYERFTYTLRTDCLESATPTHLGGSTIDRVFFYDEIREVCRYRVTDWSALARIILVFFLAGGIGLGIWTGVPSPTAAIVLWTLGLGWIGFEIYRGFVLKKSMVRIIGNKQSATFGCRSDSFFEEFIGRLRTANPEMATPVATHPAPTPTSEPPSSMADFPVPPPPPAVEAQDEH